MAIRFHIEYLKRNPGFYWVRTALGEIEPAEIVYDPKHDCTPQIKILGWDVDYDIFEGKRDDEWCEADILAKLPIPEELK